MTPRKKLGIIVHAPALEDSDRRPLAIVQAMEHALPGVRMEWEVSDDGHLNALPRRDAWLVERIEDGGFPLVCNGDESHPVTVWGMEKSGLFGPGGQAQFEVHAELPLDAVGLAATSSVLEGVAEGARALWGHATPFRAGVEIARQTVDPVHKPGVPPRGLPALELPEKIPAPEIPARLGWLNYWSDAAARTIGFPDPARDADLLSRSRRTASGGWIVQLTDAPLDLDNPEHLNVLKQTYERFPGIGGRSIP